MKKISLLFALFLIFVFGRFIVFAQGQQASPAMAAATELMAQKKYEAAAVSLEAIVKTEPQNGPAWYQLASARYFLKQYQAAADAYLKNIPISDNPFAMYNLAGVYSLIGDKERSLEWLQKAIDNPKMIFQVMDLNDNDFANVRDDSRFAVIRDKVDRKVRPCMYSNEARQFDFWVGEWEAYNPQGRHDAHSSIQRFAGGCGILENWMPLYGEGGKSINFYDAEEGKWFQYWIGSNGSPGRYSGAYRDGALRYEAESTGPDGKRILQKLTFIKIDANTVRQLSEKSDDEGKTWKVLYDYKYVRSDAKK